MTEHWAEIIGAVLTVFVAVGIGSLSRAVGWLSEEADRSLLRLIVGVLMPCFIVKVVLGNPALRESQNLLVPPLVGYAAVVLGLLIGLAVARLGRRITGLADAPQRRTFALCVGLFNYGYIPLPLVALLFKDDKPTLGVLLVHNVGVELAMWTLGVMIVSGTAGKGWWRHVINPPSVTIVAAVALNCLHLSQRVPSFILGAIELLGAAAIPMSLVLVGATIADEFRPGGLLKRGLDAIKVMTWSCLLRLGLIPVLFLIAAGLLPDMPELRRVIVVQAAMPTAVFTVVLARLYGGDPTVALWIVISTTSISLITMPLWIPGGLRLLGL
jgi:predicted permease